ncbi:YfhO family protein [uncultured Muribaculum sp.]|uniref:YfhO family protein n=1 Tax=uncultured Muribaculum sp. TaxID=1918613 RepID=UPI0026E51A55|nr:YfhO family protein [uncultured Muribaculum sp.]
MTDNQKTSVADRVKMALRSQKIWQTIVSIAIMAIISLAFFHPDAVEGNQLRQHDMQQGAAIGHEAQVYQEQTGEKSWWTNSLFSGMPTFQISPTYSSDSLFSWITDVYGLGLPAPSNLLFMMMMGFFILMLAMRVRWYYGLIGAVAWGFSTYFIIIIGAGHIWKFVTLSYIPPTIAGIIMAYRGRWLVGSGVAALFAMMQIASNHVQMTYYFLFVILGLVIAFLIEAVKTGRTRRWSIATASLAVAGVLAVCANMPSLYNTYEYSKETIRGNHSELTVAQTTDGNATSGLDRDYITQYSYGVAETFSLMIPDIKGGASARPEQGQMKAMSLADLPETAKLHEAGKLGDVEMTFLNYMSQYFGEPEGTNGPVYVGVIIFALFLVGCVIVKGPVKWALLVLTLLSVLLAMGRNCQWLTDLFIDYFPMYSKFRTVESILVIAEFTIPLLAILALQMLLTAEDRRRYVKPVAWCFGTVALFCLAGIFCPGIYGKVVTAQDEQISQMIGQQLSAQGYPREAVAMFSINNPSVYHAVSTLRNSMIESDSLRSLLFLAGAFLALLFWSMKRIHVGVAATVVGVLVFADLFSVNKRYLNHDSFCDAQLSAADPFPLSANDRAILQDTAMNYRVMNIPEFWQASPSYHHKMIGGYHAAKLTRYQDLIDRHLNGVLYGQATDADMNVLDMLNARYVIDHSGELTLNPGALGNAWFVDSLRFVAGADAEMDALSVIDPATEAVADERFRDILPLRKTTRQPGDTIFETSYAPDRLTYHASSANGGTAVFSEVYFPYGWNATIDGKPVEIARVNYVLRAIDIPAGDHTVVMEFKPRSIAATTTVASVSVILIYLIVALGIVNSLIHYRLRPGEDETV